jgi:hypothetical protein
MGIKRYYASKDNTITNAFMENLTTRGTGSNMGASDILEVFSIYAQANSSSAESSRVLIKFDCTASSNSIKSDRAAGVLPASGSVNFYLRLFNAPHGQTLPKSYTMDISAVSSSGPGGWTEGTGLDMETYKDKGNSNWTNRIASRSIGDHAWINTGGDYYTDSSSSFSASFDLGTEDLEVDITTLVEQWVNSAGNVLGSKDDEGVGIKISSDYEGAARSYYTKKFFARGTEFYFKKPCIEARWDSSVQDDRGNFYYSSSLATSTENLNTLYLYNYFRGRLRNIPDIGADSIRVCLFSGSTAPSGPPLTLVADGTHVVAASPTVITGSYVSTGIYKASVALTSSTTPLESVYDVWFSGSDSVADATSATQYFTASISPKTLNLSTVAPSDEHVISIKNLKNVYRYDETARFRVYTRQKNWSPTIYSKAVSVPEVEIVESGSFEIYRIADDLKVIPYGTGSDYHTVMSYDASGSYFDLDMNMLEPGYGYGIKFCFYNEDVGDWVEQPDGFKFRVESRQS